MSALSIQPTFPIFTETNGQPLENGYIFLGAANLNPQTNPIAAFFNAALTIPAVQPIRTQNGYPVYQGTPARIYVNSDYSIQVQNKNGSVVYSAPAATERYSDVVVTANAEDVIYDPPFTNAVQTNVEAKLAQTVSVKDFGAVGDGVTDDAPAVLAAATYISSLGGGVVCFPAPSVAYAMDPTYFDNLSNVSFVGDGAKIISRQPGTGAFGPFHMRYCTDLEMTGLDVDGRYPYWLTQPQGPQLNQNNFNIVLVDCRRVRIHDNYLHDSGVNRAPFDKFGDGVIVYGSNDTLCNNISITNNRFKDDGRWSVAVLAGSNIDVSNNVATRSSTTCPAIGFIDFEYDPGVGFGNNINITNNMCNGACEIVSSQNISPGYRNVVVSGNVLNGFYSDGTQRVAGPYTFGIGLRDMANLTVANNVIYGVASDNIQVVASEAVTVTGNVMTAVTLFPVASIFADGLTNAVVMGNLIYNNSAVGYGIQSVNSSNVSVIGNDVTNSPNWAIILGGAGGGNRLINNKMVGAAGAVCDVGGSPMIIMGNSANSSGRLDVQAHTVIGNQMAFNTLSGSWFNGGGRYTIPDGTHSRSMLWFTAAPVAGTWARGDIVFKADATVGQPVGWMCTVAGTPGTWVAMANL